MSRSPANTADETPREPWRFGDVGDTTYETILAFIRLRYRLLPYLYTLQGWEAHRGYTGMRALAFVAVDFFVGRKPHDVSLREAGTWTV
ncbi:TIM-barrel domain-containing protein, partial [Streptomyces africanus]|uniref:TIM-barrel domain-containing protein n=1 Tax=Streptomyces africanus TaxID=231024 RepID=UPI00117EEBB4